MRQIRMSCFETNSSSEHSLAIMSEENYEKWRNREVLYDSCANVIVNCEEISKERVEEEAEQYYNSIKSRLYKDWRDLDEEDREHYRQRARRQILGDETSGVTYSEFTDDFDITTTKFKTESGDKIVAVSAYGYR